MANSRGGGRLAWKDRIDKRSWVDDSPWLTPPSAEDEESVEFLEVEPTAYRLSDSDSAPPGRLTASAPFGSSALPKAAAIAALATVLVMLILMSRPSDEDPIEQLPLDKQLEFRQLQELRERSAAPEASGADDSSEAVVEDQAEAPVEGEPIPTVEDDPTAIESLPPVPSLPRGLPADLSGRLLAAGAEGSLVTLELTTGVVDEIELPVGDADAAVNELQQLGSELFVHRGERLLQVIPGGGVEGPTAPIEEILAADQGLTIVVRGEDSRVVYILPLPGQEVADPLESWRFGDDVRLIGSWQGRILVEKGGTVWLVDREGNSEEVTTGRFMDYDGRHLTMIRCDGPDACRIESGKPLEPDRRLVPIPESLADRSLPDWTASAAVSSDGRRLALIDNRDGLSVPIWIDLDTGKVMTLPDDAGVNSPLAWSPDDRYLAYANGTEVVAWRLEDGTRLGFELLRQVDHLLWSDASVEADG